MHAIAALVANKLSLTMAKIFGDKSTSIDDGVRVTIHQWRGISYVTKIENYTPTYFIDGCYIFRHVGPESESVCVANCINQHEAHLLVELINSTYKGC